MNKRHGLGKGLGALIPENDKKPKEKKYETNISINMIKANNEQPRKNFDSEKISQLAESIKEHGIIQPIILKKESDSYVVIAGERRWRAAKSIGLKEVPAVVKDEITDKEILEISLIENIQREDLNPIEEALAYKKLLSEFGLTQEELSKRVGKSRTTITNCLRLLNLDKRVQDYLIDKVLSEGHGRALLTIEDNDIQYELAQKVIDESLSVRDIERIVKTLGKNKNTNKKNDKIDNPYYKDLKNRLEDYFGTKVSLNNKKDKGKIEIEYYSEEDLQRILEILKM